MTPRLGAVVNVAVAVIFAFDMHLTSTDVHDTERILGINGIPGI